MVYKYLFIAVLVLGTLTGMYYQGYQACMVKANVKALKSDLQKAEVTIEDVKKANDYISRSHTDPALIKRLRALDRAD